MAKREPARTSVNQSSTRIRSWLNWNSDLPCSNCLYSWKMLLREPKRRVREETVYKHFKYGVCEQGLFLLQFSVWGLKDLCSKDEATATPRAHEWPQHRNGNKHFNVLGSKAVWHSRKSMGPLIYELCDLDGTEDLNALSLCCFFFHKMGLLLLTSYG